jgi:glycosyltransferase involved in cell wall biosynthesis
MNNTEETLALVMPIYNEEDIIEKVITDWDNALKNLSINYKIFAYNDGSQDKTGEILAQITDKMPNLVVINQPNSWHGPTILRGYRDNAPNFTWIFQMDADNEMGAQDFHKMWEKRNEFDFLIAKRDGREQSFSRKLISFASRVCIRFFYGNGPWDVNSPYRLMRSEKFIEWFNKLPPKTLSPNMILSGIVARKKIKFTQIPTPCSQRKTGIELKHAKLFKTAIKSFWQCMVFAFTI